MGHLPEDPVRRLADDPPTWFARLGKDLGVEWIEPAQWAPVVVEDYPARTMLLEHLVDADRDLRTGKVLVARGPSTTHRASTGEANVCWYLDPLVPDRLG